jgi:hypothetical protein
MMMASTSPAIRRTAEQVPQGKRAVSVYPISLKVLHIPIFLGNTHKEWVQEFVAENSEQVPSAAS